MGGQGSQSGKKSRSERWKFGVDLVNAHVALLGTVALIGFIAFSWAVFDDLRPARAFLEKTLPGSLNTSADSGLVQLPSPRVSPTPPGLVYLSIPAPDLRLGADLERNLRDSGIQVTDDLAQSATTIEITTDVALRPGLTVGSSATWQAVAISSLTASDSKSRATLFRTAFEGHGTATQADTAKRYAVDDAVSHIAAAYENFAKTGKH